MPSAAASITVGSSACLPLDRRSWNLFGGEASAPRTQGDEDLGPVELVDRDEVRLQDASMMLVDRPWPLTTSAPGPSSDERRQRTSTWPWASSPADTALISYSVSTGRQPRTGWMALSTALNRALTGPLPVDSDRAFSSPDRARPCPSPGRRESA